MRPILTLALAACAAPALAQEAMDHSAMGGMEGGMGAMMGAMDTMMGSMGGMESTGDPDADFLLMMIPHHQSAIDMARMVLEQGDDEATRAMAQAIIDAQEAEIEQMKAMLAGMGHPVE